MLKTEEAAEYFGTTAQRPRRVSDHELRRGAAVTAPYDRKELVLSIRDVAKLLGVSDDLVYELAARGEIPCLRLGRRRLIPRRAVELMIERSLEAFDPAAPSSGLP